MVDKTRTAAANDPTLLIARRLRAERLRRQWSLDQMARHVGVSKAMLSKLERGEASPTAVLLGRISGALGVTLSSRLAEAEQGAARLLRLAQQPTWIDPQTGYRRRQVSPLGSGLPLQMIEVELPLGAEIGFPAAAYGFIRQLIWVLAGRSDFAEGPAVHRSSPGDCLELGAPADCVFRNRSRSRRPGRYLVVVMPR